MGMPLPKGRIRVYKLDDNGSQQFVGEDRSTTLPRTRRSGSTSATRSTWSATTSARTTRRSAEHVIEETFQVKIRNHKETPVEVKVVDHVWSDWKVTKSSHEFNKKDAHTIEFPVTVPKDGEDDVTYTIRTYVEIVSRLNTIKEIRRFTR